MFIFACSITKCKLSRRVYVVCLSFSDDKTGEAPATRGCIMISVKIYNVYPFLTRRNGFGRVPHTFAEARLCDSLGFFWNLPRFVTSRFSGYFGVNRDKRFFLLIFFMSCLNVQPSPLARKWAILNEEIVCNSDHCWWRQYIFRSVKSIQQNKTQKYFGNV